MRARRGIAMVVVFGLILLIVPVVMTMSARTHQTIKWYAKQERQKRALELAQQAMVTARESLANQQPGLDGSVQVPNGAKVYKTLFWSRGELAQPLYLCAGEGLYLGEERMVVSLCEVLPADTATPGVPAPVATPALVLEHDRQWIYSESGGTPLVPGNLLDLYRSRMSTFLGAMRAESQMQTQAYTTALTNQVQNVDCPDISDPALGPLILQALPPSQFQ